MAFEDLVAQAKTDGAALLKNSVTLLTGLIGQASDDVKALTPAAIDDARKYVEGMLPPSAQTALNAFAGPIINQAEGAAVVALEGYESAAVGALIHRLQAAVPA